MLRATGSFPTTTAGYRAMRQVARQWPKRMWAVEGAAGTGRPLAQRLLTDGERLLPPSTVPDREPVIFHCPRCTQVVDLDSTECSCVRQPA